MRLVRDSLAIFIWDVNTICILYMLCVHPATNVLTILNSHVFFCSYFDLILNVLLFMRCLPRNHVFNKSIYSSSLKIIFIRWRHSMTNYFNFWYTFQFEIQSEMSKFIEKYFYFFFHFAFVFNFILNSKLMIYSHHESILCIGINSLINQNLREPFFSKIHSTALLIYFSLFKFKLTLSFNFAYVAFHLIKITMM